MIVNIKEDKERKIITIVDDNLFGKRFSEGDFILDLTYKYFSGEKKNSVEIEELLEDKDVYLVNFIGEESVSLALELGLIDDYKEIAGIKYAFYLNLN
ncbi:MAG: hypothetical protein PWP03_777 [Candidatus Woesearchaeota archaeon]|nr:hypothetical protein [Candidatus Woesearchaeota archaeon]MDN5328139.1 hypothetical protein [Candidatus Woesearchaeota archaeon]